MANVDVTVSAIEYGDLSWDYAESITILVAQTGNVVDSMRPGVVDVESESLGQSAFKRRLQSIIGRISCGEVLANGAGKAGQLSGKGTQWRQAGSLLCTVGECHASTSSRTGCDKIEITHSPAQMPT